MSTSERAAGWYPDPQDVGFDRWWDGAAWTEHRHEHDFRLDGAPMAAAPSRTSGSSIVALVLGVLSLLLCGLFTGVPAMLAARSAKRDISVSNGRVGGDGLATAGFVTGLIGTLWSGFVALLVVVVFASGVSPTGSGGGGDGSGDTGNCKLVGTAYECG